MVPHKIDWLFDDEINALEISSKSQKTILPLPPQIGVGYTEHVDLFDGVEIIRDTITFNQDSCPPQVPLGKFNSVYPTAVLAINTIHSGSLTMSSKEQKRKRQPGVDLFARFQEFEITQVLNTDKNLSVSNLIVPELSLHHLMGQEAAQVFFENLGLRALGDFAELSVPRTISGKLENCVPESLSGKMRSLFGQSIVMQYFLELNLHTLAKQGFLKVNDRNASIAKAVHAELLKVTGNIPSLNELASKHGVSTAKLNALYFKQYNESIYSFLSNQRLDQAYQALKSTNMPMKVLAYKIGYSHVNHFITAFKKKFGVTPGSLRKSK